MSLLFNEKQRFTQWWLWLLLLGITLLPTIGIYQQIYQGQPYGNNPMSDTGLILFFIFMLIFLLFFRSMHLSTKINRQKIEIKFFPFLSRSFRWKDIKSATIVDYGFVGGWGIRLGTKYGTIYNVKGKMGLAFELQNGKKYCIGTQQAAELKNLIAALDAG